jgi:hypothetical protein
MSTSDEAVFKQGRAAEAFSNPALAGVPDKHKSFFQTFTGKPKTQPSRMNITGKVRPEEEAKLRQLGWDGVSDLPANLASMLNMKSEEEVLAEMAKGKRLTLEDVEVVPYEQAAKEHKENFDNMVARLEAMEGPKPVFINSKATPPVAQAPARTHPAVTTEVVQPMVYNGPPPNLTQPAPVKSKTVAELLAETRPPAPPTTSAPSIQPDQPDPATAPKTAASQTGVATEAPAICPRCKLDQSLPYPVMPTQLDIQNRIIAFGSAAQGGDGRFRKSYPVFGGAITLSFRELTTEGDRIYRTEGSNAVSSDPQIARLQQVFSLDRIMFRRHCCGLEAIETPAKKIEIPPLESWIANSKGDVEAALQDLEKFVREQCYNNESLQMLAGRCWEEFELLVRALWSDQSFYNGML